MVREMVQPYDSPSAALAHALRELRERGWPGVTVTQAHIAKALEVSPALISSWENTRSPKTPPEARLAAYATFFATQRSIGPDGGRLIDPSELDPEEQERRGVIARELQRLREAIDAEHGQEEGVPPPVSRISRSGPWYFPDERPVTIACAPLPERLRGAFADPQSPDYSPLHLFGDVDALVELHGYIRAVNPDTTVVIRDASRMRGDDYTNNLIILGGVDWNDSLVRVLALMSDLPIRQESRDEDLDSGAFVVVDVDDSPVQRFQPTTELIDGRLHVLEDVAHFFRGPNPYNHKRTVSICNGAFGKGTYGVVRALTDPKFRDRNASYLRSRFGSAGTYSILSRVRLAGTEVLTPDWTQPEMRLHEWSGAHA